MLLPDEVIEKLRGSHQLGIFLRLDTDPPVRLWLGINDIEAGIYSVDPTTQERYLGAGRLAGIPNLEAALNGVADRVEIQLSGVDPDTADLAEWDEVDVRGKAFHIAITTLDDHYQPMSAPIPVMTGRASFVSCKDVAVSGPVNNSVTISLSVGFGITTRDRSAMSLWSPAHQRALYPTDAFCDGVSRLERGVAPAWPRF